MKYFVYIGIIILIFNNVIYAQNRTKVDSLHKIIKTNTLKDTLKASKYLELADLTLYNTPQEAKVYIDKSLKLNQKAKYPTGLAKSFAKKAAYFYVTSTPDSIRHYLNKSIGTYLTIGDTTKAAAIRHNIGIMDLSEGNYESCRQIMDSIIPIFKKAKDALHLGNAYLVKGKVALVVGHYNIALKESYKALQIHEKIDNKVRIAEDLLQIGRLHSLLDKHDDAISVYNRSYKLYDDLGYTQPKSQVLAYKAESYLSLKRYDEAHDTFDNALKLSQDIDYTANIARIKIQLGALEYEIENYDSSLEYLKKGLDLWSSLKNPNNVADAKLKIGKTYLAQNKYSKAKEYLTQAIQIAESLDASKLLEDTHNYRAKVNAKLGDYNAAFLDQKKSKEINEMLVSTNQAKVIEELNITYETEKRIQEIDNQNKAIKILEQDSKIKTLRYVILFILLLLVGIIFSLYIFRIKRKNRKRLRIAQSQLEKKEIEKLKSDLALVNRENELKKAVIENSITEEVLNKILDDIKEIITFENERERSSALKSLSLTLLSEKFSKKPSSDLQSLLNKVDVNFKILLDKIEVQLNPKEKELLCLMKLGLSTPDISKLQNKTIASVKSTRYRVRKKFALDSHEDIVTHLDQLTRNT